MEKITLSILKGLEIVNPDEVCGLRNRWQPQVKQRKKELEEADGYLCLLLPPLVCILLSPQLL